MLPTCHCHHLLQTNPAAAEDLPVYLYSKAFLRPGARPPSPEPLPAVDVRGELGGNDRQPRPPI